MRLGRRRLIGAAAAISGSGLVWPANAEPRFEPSPGLLDAARRDGKLTLYTAQIEELEQEAINAFNQRFPFVRVELVHAPGGQLITRIKSEMAAGKLVADILDLSDPNVLKPLEDALLDYAPPMLMAFCRRRSCHRRCGLG